MHNVHDHRHGQHPHRYVLPLELVELDLSLGFAGQHRTRYRSSQLRSELSTGQDTQPDTHEGLLRGRQSFSITPCQARIGSVPEQSSQSSDMTAQTTRTTLTSSSHSRLADGGATSAQII